MPKSATVDGTSQTQKPIAVTCGDPSGIGPDIIMDAWQHRAKYGLPDFYVLGDPEQLEARAALLGMAATIENAETERTSDILHRALPVSPLSHPLKENPGQPLAENAAGVIEAIDRAVQDVFTDRASAVVTAPVSKKPLYDAGFAHPGHTEYLAELAAQRTGLPAHPVMMIAGPNLRTIPVTIHMPLADVKNALTTDLVVKTVKAAHKDLKNRFGIAKPRIAVSGLNPHAGENGALGTEDDEIIRPAVEQLAAEGIDAVGPLPADTMFHAQARARYDVAICMYHDQALIPAKALDFDEGVNVTLGLPFIRTSPDHGTAFDIAGKGIARPNSFVAALKMAAQMVEASQNAE